MKPSLVSFVVPAWNEEALLPATLRSIHESAAAAGIEYELVVADDDSSDGTAEVARAHEATVVSCRNRQIAATRNAGARASSGDLLIFCDADTRATPGAVLGVVEAVTEGATYGGATVDWDGDIPNGSRRLLRLALGGYRRMKLAPGAFFFCRRKAFEVVGGFDESLYAAEEYYLSKALKRVGRFGWVEAPVVTSGRKLRAYRLRELLGATLRLSLRGKRGLRRRQGLDIWYADRRPDPGGEG